MFLTKDRVERTATENQFMNGKIQAIKVYCRRRDTILGAYHLDFNVQSYRSLTNTSLKEYFPDIAPYLDSEEIDAT